MELKKTARIDLLKERMLSQPRYVSMEQAMIITRAYQKHEQEPIILKRAHALHDALCELEIGIEPQELIVGNRTKGVRYGVVFPESGISWVDQELETLPTRPQDKFLVHPEDVQIFREVIKPYWKGRSLEDVLRQRYGEEIRSLSTVVKINQKDHAQGHICPNVREWLEKGPAGLQAEAQRHLQDCKEEQRAFYESIRLVMDGVCRFLMRYHDELIREASHHPEWKQDMEETAAVCKALSKRPRNLSARRYSPYGFCLSSCIWKAMPPASLRGVWMKYCIRIIRKIECWDVWMSNEHWISLSACG